MNEKVSNDIEVPKIVRSSNGEVQMSFTSDHMSQWIREGIIPLALAKYFQESQERINQHHAQMKEFKTQHPNGTSAEYAAFLGYPKSLTNVEIEHLHQEAKLFLGLHSYMVDNWEMLITAIVDDSKTTLYKSILHPGRQFGVARIETDNIYYLKDLLEAMKIKHLKDNDYIARGEIKNSNECSVALEYEFGATNYEHAMNILGKYKRMMLTKGLRAFFAYWHEANQQGGLTVDCSISDVMDLFSSDDRTAYHNDKERSDFWLITRALEKTKFILEWPARDKNGKLKKSKTSQKVEWVQQPLLQIHSGENELGEECPIRIKATVLTKQSAKLRFMPAVYSNKTLKLHPIDIFFAAVIQCRAAQLSGSDREISLGWDFTFKLANVEGTAKTNPRAAKAKVRKKLNAFRNDEIIENWSEDEAKIHIQPQKNRKKAPIKRVSPKCC